MRLKSKFEAGDFVILAEMEPPKGIDVSEMVANAMKVKGRVDAFVIPEMSSAVMRMSALGGAMVLQARGMDTVMQICCRDRNRIALQADMLAGNACGISNVMAVTGENPSFGDHHDAKAVYDIELIELLRASQNLQRGRDLAGIELDGAPKFFVGSTVNAGVSGQALELELEELNKKIEAGARFFVTPPVFDLKAISAFRERVEKLDIRIVPTVLLLKSLGMARYIDRNLNNVLIPKSIIQRIQKAGDKVRECSRIASEMVSTLKSEGFSGVMLSTLGWEDRIPEVLDGAQKTTQGRIDQAAAN